MDDSNVNTGYGRIIQTVGVIGVLIAIELEVYTQQDLWLILATAGSMLFAIGTKVVYFSRRRKRG